LKEVSIESKEHLGTKKGLEQFTVLLEVFEQFIAYDLA
jgi:hypothetical protein